MLIGCWKTNFFRIFMGNWERNREREIFRLNMFSNVEAKSYFFGLLCTLNRPWLTKKKRALKFALKESENCKPCFKLYRYLNPEKSCKFSFKNAFCSLFLISVARCFDRVQVKYSFSSSTTGSSVEILNLRHRAVSSVVRFVGTLLLLLLSKLPSWVTVYVGDGFLALRCDFLQGHQRKVTRFKPSLKML